MKWYYILVIFLNNDITTVQNQFTYNPTHKSDQFNTCDIEAQKIKAQYRHDGEIECFRATQAEVDWRIWMMHGKLKQMVYERYGIHLN